MEQHQCSYRDNGGRLIPVDGIETTLIRTRDGSWIITDRDGRTVDRDPNPDEWKQRHGIGTFHRDIIILSYP